MDEVIEFINKFKKLEQNDVLVDTFTRGYCYYFAVILQERFGGEILYAPIEGHFVTRIHDKLYDIRGEVPEGYHPRLEDKSTWMSKNSIISGCILKN